MTLPRGVAFRNLGVWPGISGASRVPRLPDKLGRYTVHTLPWLAGQVGVHKRMVGLKATGRSRLPCPTRSMRLT